MAGRDLSADREAVRSVVGLLPESTGYYGWMTPVEMFMTAQAVLLLGLLSVTVTAVHVVAGERERGTLEAVLVAPMSPPQLLRGYLAGGALAPWAGS